MRLITEKNKNEIGKRLSTIYYIAVHGFGKGTKTDLESMEKIIEHVHDIAFAVGGKRFSNIDIPAYVMRIEEMVERRTDKGLPSADPEIIRCKDCAKREYCRTSTVWAVAPSDDWYCADAERRTG